MTTETPGRKTAEGSAPDDWVPHSEQKLSWATFSWLQFEHRGNLTRARTEAAPSAGAVCTDEREAGKQGWVGYLQATGNGRSGGYFCRKSTSFATIAQRGYRHGRRAPSADGHTNTPLAFTPATSTERVDAKCTRVNQ